MNHPMEAAAPGTSNRGTMAFLWAALAGAAVSLVLGVYAREHEPAGQALFTLGFSGTINMKAWLATLALALAIVQVLLALWMYGKLGRRGAPPWVGPTHRLVGTLAFLVTLPVAYHCLWSLGFETRRRIDAPLRPLAPRLPLLRRVHGQGPLRALGADAGLGAPGGRRPAVRLPRRAVADERAVVLHNVGFPSF